MLKPIYIVFVAVALLVAIAIASLFVPESKFSHEEYEEIQHSIYLLNKSLPEQTTLGQLDKVEFKDNTYVLYLRIYGDRSVLQFYLTREDLRRKLIKDYILICCHGINASPFYRLFIDKDVNFRCVFTLPDGTKIVDEYNSSDLKMYVDNVGMTSQEALSEIIKISIDISKSYNVHTSVYVALSTLYPPTEAIPVNVWVEDDNTIVCLWWARDNDYLDMLDNFMDQHNAIERLKWMVYEIRKDGGEVGVFFDTFEQANAKLVFRFGTCISNRMVDVPVPIVNKELMRNEEVALEIKKKLINK